MPTFATIALENLFEPGFQDSLKNPLHGDSEEPNPRNRGPRHLYISPDLYTTPEQAPIPGNAAPDSPSPYVVNNKRRRGGSVGSGVPELPSGKEGDGLSLEEKEVVVEENLFNENVFVNDAVGEEDEGFPDLKGEGESAENEEAANDSSRNQFESRSYVSAQGEFFDAIEEFSSDGSVSNITSDESQIQSEWHPLKLSLLEEIERRKTAEENLTLMCSQWESVRNIMSEAGLTFPAPPVASDSMQLENNLVDQISQEVLVTRFVAEAIGRGQARAEAEEAAATIIELKDQEIQRLRDRLQYFESVNHELSQRNLVEVVRRQQERKRSRRRWLWSFMGLSIAAGASAAAYYYIPRASECLSLLDSGNSADTSSGSISETSQVYYT